MKKLIWGQWMAVDNYYRTCLDAWKWLVSGTSRPVSNRGTIETWRRIWKLNYKLSMLGKNVSLLLISTGDFYWGPFETRYVQNSILTLSIWSEAAVENSNYLTEKPCCFGQTFYLPGLLASVSTKIHRLSALDHQISSLKRAGGGRGRREGRGGEGKKSICDIYTARLWPSHPEYAPSLLMSRSEDYRQQRQGK